MKVAARAIADRNTLGHRSYRVATRRQSLSLPNMRSMRLRRLCSRLAQPRALPDRLPRWQFLGSGRLGPGGQPRRPEHRREGVGRTAGVPGDRQKRRHYSGRLLIKRAIQLRGGCCAPHAKFQRAGLSHTLKSRLGVEQLRYAYSAKR
jgi:hypothetical protein